MFALEIKFNDGVSPPEVLLVRRPHAIIGASDYSHVVIEGFASNLCELRLTRGLGRQLRCQPVSRTEDSSIEMPFSDKVYDSEAELALGEITTYITALDVDLQLNVGESPDLAGVRILRQALSKPIPVFPAVALLGAVPVFVSFAIDERLIVGRSRKCGLRLDATDVSSEHARIGFDGERFWIEDLGSKNGTFVGEERVQGRRTLREDESVTIGAEFLLKGVRNDAEVLFVNEQKKDDGIVTVSQMRLYPCLLSQSELVQPSRFILNPGSKISIGRDPSSDIWIGSAHVSRKHAEIRYNDTGDLSIIDLSSNGTLLNDEPLPSGVVVEIPHHSSVFNTGVDVELTLCFCEADEAKFIDVNSVAAKSNKTNGSSTQLKQSPSDFPMQGEQWSSQENRKDEQGQLTSNVFEKLVERAGGESDSTWKIPKVEDVKTPLGVSSDNDINDENSAVHINKGSPVSWIGRLLLNVAALILIFFIVQLLLWLLEENRFI